MKKKKYFFSIFSAITLLVNINTFCLADEDVPEKVLETKELGDYILGKIVDSENDNIVSDANIITSITSTKSNKDGTFFIQVKEDDFLSIKKDGYEDFKEKISNLKGKIKLKRLPFKYVPLLPMISITGNYLNKSFSEKYQNIDINGNFNDSFNFSLEASLFNVLLGANYENNSLNINRPKLSESIPTEKQLYTNNNIETYLGYLVEFERDQLAILPNLKFSFNNIKTKNLEKVETERDLDYIDFDQDRTILSLGVNTFYRPFKYKPYVFTANLSYSPFNSVKTDYKEFPTNLNSLGYSIGFRYDILGAVINLAFIGKNTFGDKFSSNSLGFSIGTGYTF
ncbi:MAG: hypothetical protein U0457_10155 [Candidatus Sericytochromatia bacterium]